MSQDQGFRREGRLIDGPGALVRERRKVLYFGRSAEAMGDLARLLSQVEGCQRRGSGASLRLDVDQLAVSLEYEGDVERLLDALQHHYVSLVIFDLRCAQDMECLRKRTDETFHVLDTLDKLEDVETRYPPHRAIVLLPAMDVVEIDRMMLAFGRRGVGAVLRHRQTTAEAIGTAPISESDAAFACALLGEVEHVLTASRYRAKRALCAAGGGITGIYFEMGVLKCLQDCLPGNALNTFDMYFGISAGAVVTGLISAGYSVDEFMAAVAGVEGGRLKPIDMRLFRLGHLDYPAIFRRVGNAVTTSMALLGSMLRFWSPPTSESVLFDYADLLIPPFRANGFEAMLRHALSVEGATNDFRKLPRPLYVGATDQDERQHVLFGDEGHNDIPISVAIQASISLNPAFSSTYIRGRYYEDGAVTRTSNFLEAIRREAGLIFVVDPFVPYVARGAGFATRRGLLYNFDQNIRTISYTRFENARNWMLRRYPDVSSYTFLPANRLRRLLSVSPFDHRQYLEIWRGAYLSTLQRLQRLRHRIGGDVEAYGMKLDMSRGEAVAERLAATPSPDFADFFVDRRVQLQQPPLCLQRADRPDEDVSRESSEGEGAERLVVGG